MILRRDQQLVGRPAGCRNRERDGAVAELALGQLQSRVELALEIAKRTAVVLQPRRLGHDLRRSLLQPDELGVRMRKSRPGSLALVDRRQEMVETLCPGALGRLCPGLRDQTELVVADMGDRASVG